MNTRENLLKSPMYWLTVIQNDLFNALESYMEEKGLNRTQLANKLGVSKGYVSQVLNGDADHRLSKIVELSMAIGKVPKVEFVDIDKVIKQDEEEILTPSQLSSNKLFLLPNLRNTSVTVSTETAFKSSTTDTYSSDDESYRVSA